MAMKPVYNESTYSNTFYSVTQLSSSFFPRLIEPCSAAAIKQQADSNRRCGTSQYVSSQRVMQARVGSQDFRYEHFYCQTPDGPLARLVAFTDRTPGASYNKTNARKPLPDYNHTVS